MDAALFSLFNVGVGFIIAWLISHYLLPRFGYERSFKRTTGITMIFTVSAIFRNLGVYTLWTM